MLYTQCFGIAAHALALKIYNAPGEIEIDSGEASLIEQTVKQHCTPFFIDAILAQLNREPESSTAPEGPKTAK